MTKAEDLAQKFLKQEELGRIKEEINMTYLGQLIFNDGVEAGIKQGVEKGIEKVSCK